MMNDKKKDYINSPTAEGLTENELDSIAQPSEHDANGAITEEDTFNRRGLPLNPIVEEVEDSRSNPSNNNLNSGEKFE